MGSNVWNAVVERTWHWFDPLFRAFREVGGNAIIGLTPVWAGAFLNLLIADHLSLREALITNTARGDLFLAATTVAAPIALYITIRRRDIPKPMSVHFPGGFLYFVLLLLLFAACIILFSVKRLADLGIGGLSINQEMFQASALLLFVFSLVLALVVTFTKFRLDEIDPGIFRQGQAEFDAEWQGRQR
jgi:hypothetical protein